MALCDLSVQVNAMLAMAVCCDVLFVGLSCVVGSGYRLPSISSSGTLSVVSIVSLVALRPLTLGPIPVRISISVASLFIAWLNLSWLDRRLLLPLLRRQ